MGGGKIRMITGTEIVIRNTMEGKLIAFRPILHISGTKPIKGHTTFADYINGKLTIYSGSVRTERPCTFRQAIQIIRNQYGHQKTLA